MNPFLPLEYCIPDGEPRVFGDRVYIYGSCDTVNAHVYCSSNYYVFSASIYDLEHWTNHGIVFASQGPNSEVSWSKGMLYAPDVIEKEGIYYMYFCLSDGSEGVATSLSPAGPFTHATRMYYPKSIEEGGPLRHIDPAAFVDEDGKAYYYWGQFQAQAAQLEDNMRELIDQTYQSAIITEEQHFFHEGSSMRKIGDTYYLIYCDISTKRANSLAYATSKSPLGPFTYQGVIINNYESDPESWNNHGSIVEINGQWYIFYHRSSNNSVYSRRACAEPIFFDEKGKIRTVEMTTQGFSPSPSAYDRMTFSRACYVKNGSYLTQDEHQAHIVVNNKNGSIIGFKYLDFGPLEAKGELNFSVRINPLVEYGSMEIILDSQEGVVIGTLAFQKTEEEWVNLSTQVQAVSGIHAVYFKFYGNSDESLCDINWFSFLSS
jgi:arabinoxylan arabinofuranohydrolase